MLRPHRSVMRPIHGTALFSASCTRHSKEGGLKMKAMIIALSAAALVAAAPAALAQDVPGKTPALQHKSSKKHQPGVSSYAQTREMQAKGSKTGYPGASGYAPDERSRFFESVRQGGGGGGGGGGGSGM